MADIQVANTDSDLSENTLITEENAYTITGLHTFSRSTNAPFAVVSGAAVVANLDADKLDGIQATGFVKADGTVALSANWDAGGYEIRANTFESDVATGTIPLVIASTTKCTNLNADKLDDQEGTYYLAAGNATGTLAVGKGGTGATTLTDGGVLLGSGTSAITATAVLGDGVILIGDASGDPTTLDVGSSTAITVLGTVATGVWQGTDVGVAYGGTGVSTLTDGGVLLGSGSSAITAMSVLTDGQMIVGDGSGDPVAESGATLRTSIGVGTGDSPVFTAVTAGQVDITGEGDLRLQDNTGGQYVGFDAPSSVSGTYTLTMPAAVGAVDQLLTLSNTDGTLQWATASGGGFPFLDKASLTSGELQTGTISLAASGLLVVWQNVECDTDDVSMQLIINGATTGYEQVQWLHRIDGNYGYGGNPTDAVYLDANIATHGRLGNATGEQTSGHAYLTCDGTYLNWHGESYEQNTNGDPTQTVFAGFINLGGVITSVTMKSSSGDIDSGEMMVYNIKES
jgi:hypothetical protein